MLMVVPKYAQQWPNLGDSRLHLYCGCAVRWKNTIFRTKEEGFGGEGGRNGAYFMEQQSGAMLVFRNTDSGVTQTLATRP